ncbi:hypothetical protein HK098_004400 [Nowakowskiella sp. JEL0407]|nr:hypothetical protein HK098_004400 [Nowakowskiella sp. JEL0407]
MPAVTSQKKKLVPPKAPITDDNVLQALDENWDPDHPDAAIGPITPKNAYEKFVISLLRDSRDLDIINFSLYMTLTVVPSAFLLFYRFSYIHAIIHLILLVPTLEKYVHALHNACHRPIFVKGASLLNLWIPYIIGPFCGQTWNTYYFHHIKMHHVADNGPEDASSTLLYQRDSLIGWLVYFGRFYFMTWYDLGFYFIQKGQYFALLPLLGGEYSLIFGALYLLIMTSQYFLPTLFVFVIPFHFVRAGMMQGNWTQHAFLDREDPNGGGRKNSITCISSSYNPRSFNDGYHASHHLNPLRHWLDHPRMFVKQRQQYYEEQAVVFKDLDYPGVWIRLVTGNYKDLAKYWIHLGDGPRPSDEEIIALLKHKTKRFTMEEVIKIYGKKTWCW